VSGGAPDRPRPARTAGQVRVVLRVVLWGLGWAYVLHALVKYLGLRASPAGLAGLCVLAVAMSRLVRTAREPLPPLPLPSQSPGGPPPDRPFERIDRIEDRLSWGGRATHHFDAGVAPVLLRIAEDRLRRRHGVDLSRSPEAARHLLGEELWQLLPAPETGRDATATTRKPPSPAEMENLVRRLETI
jgi:hypothetical protein